jgi:hypothetical protein
MSTLSRFPGGKNKENTARLINLETQLPTFATPLTVTAKLARTTVKLALTGAITINLAVGTGLADSAPPFDGDEIDFQFSNGTGGALVVTWGTGTANVAATLSVAAAKFGSARFKFDGVSQLWIMQGSSVTI